MRNRRRSRHRSRGTRPVGVVRSTVPGQGGHADATAASFRGGPPPGLADVPGHRSGDPPPFAESAVPGLSARVGCPSPTSCWSPPATLFGSPVPPAGWNRLPRRHTGPVGWRRTSLMALAMVLAAACSSNDGESATAITGVDERAAAAFITAWRAGDTTTMRQLGRPEAVDAALALGRAEGSGDCSTQPNGQYQCVVAVSRGTQTYLLVGAPGAPEGQVWWVATYVRGT
jgi:hypothetical protein